MSTTLERQSEDLDTRVSGPLRPSPWLVGVPALLFLGLATWMMLQAREPFINYFYISAWYPTILVLDVVQALSSGRYYLISRPRFALSLLWWSAVLWFFFELVNFRVANWYYVFLPPDRPIRWIGTTVSFATVFPAIFLAERVLKTRGSFDRVRWPGFTVTDRTLIGVFAAGIIFAALSLAWPRFFFPMIWGALTLLLEPLNYRHDRKRSLLADLAEGHPGRLLRFLVGGMAIGLLWEMYNIESRSKWIYTVPGLENFKLFEMPLLGFFGFPVFALDCFVVYQSLVLARVAIPESPTALAAGWRAKPGRTVGAVVIAATFSLAILFGMDRWNTDSLRPRLEGLWVADQPAKQSLATTRYRDIFVLAEAEAEEVAEATGADVGAAGDWVSAAQLSTLRGIGTENAKLMWRTGIESVADLAEADPRRLGEEVRARALRPRTATPPKVRLWVNAARRQTQASSSIAEP